MSKKSKNITATKRFPYIKAIIIIAVILLIGFVCFYSFWNTSGTNNSNSTDTTANIKDTSINNASVLQGNILAHAYCQSCHMFPDPLLLNKDKWDNIFPQMGLRLGILSHRGRSYKNAVIGYDVIVPPRPALNDKQWQSIIDYYHAAAPQVLPKQDRPAGITRNMPFFSVQLPAGAFSFKKALATYVKIDTTVKPARIFVANGITNQLFLFDNKLKVIDSVKVPGPVTDICFNKDELLLCTIGKELGANSDKAGQVCRLHIGQSGKMKLDAKPLFSMLARPVQVIAVDLNGDHKTDYLICEFGNWTGALSWMENKGDGTYTRHIINNLPGAIKAYLEYPPNSSLPNIWVLFAQAQERISHFINKGNGVFEEKQVLRFPPIYGSSSFEMVDINHDGFKDIVYTCGDNGNATVVLKPYHGVRIFLNDGNDNFKLQYFYPVNGCYKAFARDFDGDGNIDIATISLYTDARQPEEGFVYLKNTGNLNFVPYALPLDTKLERAVTMDEGDLDGDGKPDLLIGNAYFSSGPFSYNFTEPLFLILKNAAVSTSK